MIDRFFHDENNAEITFYSSSTNEGSMIFSGKKVDLPNFVKLYLLFYLSKEMSQTNTKEKTNTWNDYIDEIPLIGKFTQNYRYEPKEMFLKHILEELPNTKEIFGFAPLKFLVKGFIQFIGSTLEINLEQLNSDSTYFGSFVGTSPN